MSQCENYTILLSMMIAKIILLNIFLTLYVAALDCYQCFESYDHNGNQQGPYNDANCYSDNAPRRRFFNLTYFLYKIAAMG